MQRNDAVPAWLWVDADNQSREGVAVLAEALKVPRVERVYVAGGPSRLGVWVQAFAADRRVLVLDTLGRRKAASRMQLAVEAGRHLAEAQARGLEWWLFSGDRQFVALEAYLAECGLACQWHGQLAPEVVTELAGGEGEVYRRRLRAVARELLQRRGPVEVGDWGNEVTRRHPELARAEVRESLFGVRRFPAIARVLGLQTAGTKITWA